MKTFKIEGELAKKYHGCGSALATIKLRFDGNKVFLDQLTDFDYARQNSAGMWVIEDDQSVEMSPYASMILGYKDKAGNVIAVDPVNFFDGFDKIDGGVFATVVVNLACYEACLG